MENMYGSIDLTKLGNIVRQHPELIKKAQCKDGTTHQFISIDLNCQNEDMYGNAANLKVAVKRENMKHGVSYFFGNMKVSVRKGVQAQQLQKPARTDSQDDASSDDLPF